MLHPNLFQVLKPMAGVRPTPLDKATVDVGRVVRVMVMLRREGSRKRDRLPRTPASGLTQGITADRSLWRVGDGLCAVSDLPLREVDAVKQKGQEMESWRWGRGKGNE